MCSPVEKAPPSPKELYFVSKVKVAKVASYYIPYLPHHGARGNECRQTGAKVIHISRQERPLSPVQAS